MTDHEPDKQLLCHAYISCIALGLAIFALGVYVGWLI